jgi:hypothetical protein
MTVYHLTPPTEEYGPAGGGRLFIRYRLTRGVSLMRNKGVWSTTTFPTEDIIRAADLFYVGGHEYVITEQTYNELVAAGFGANVWTSAE